MDSFFVATEHAIDQSVGYLYSSRDVMLFNLHSHQYTDDYTPWKENIQLRTGV